MSKLSIIVPVYFNEDTLIPLYEDMKKVIFHNLDDYEIVFVDDGSGDASWDIMNALREKDEKIKCVKLSRNFGEHSAILAGLHVCTGDCAVTKQADLQEDSSIILEMYESWKKGNKVVLAVRKERDEGAVKKFFANLYYLIIRKMVDDKMPKGGCDCYLLDRRAIEVLESLDEKNSSLTLQVLWIGFQSDKIYIHRRDRKIGKSRWTFAKKMKLVLDSIMSFTYIPIRFMTLCGVLFFVLSIISAVLIIIEKLTIGTPIQGYSSMMCVILFSSGMIMLMLGILGEYIWRTLEAAKKRPPYIIDEIKQKEEA